MKEEKAKTMEVLEGGKVMEGVVKNITDYGAFIDLGGVDGLLHITDMSWGRVNHPSELFNVGDKINPFRAGLLLGEGPLRRGRLPGDRPGRRGNRLLRRERSFGRRSRGGARFLRLRFLRLGMG